MTKTKWIQRLTLAGALCFALCASGCDRSATASSISSAESEDLVYYAAGCESFSVPQGFELHWKWLNHRISYMKVRPGERQKCQPESLEAGFVGGTFSSGAFFEDTPQLSYLYQPVTSRSLEQMSAARVTVSANIGPSGVVEGTKVLSRTLLALDTHDQVIALVEGVSFHTGVEQGDSYPPEYDPANGYTMRGIGVEAEVAALTPDQIELNYAMRFETGIAPDWRPQMNRARKHARIRGHLDVLLIGLGDANIHRAPVGYLMNYPEPTFLKRQQLPPQGDKVRSSIQGKAGGPSGFVGLGKWNFRMDFPITCEDDSDCPGGESCRVERGKCTRKQGPLGDYLKTLHVSVDKTDYDPETGEATFKVIGHASNTSTGIVFAPLEYKFDAELVWAQADGAASQRSILRKGFLTGETRLPLSHSQIDAPNQRAAAETASDSNEKEVVTDERSGRRGRGSAR